MSVSYLKLKKAAFFCLSLSSCIFMLGFLKWYFSVPLVILISSAYFFALRDSKKDDDRKISLPISYIVILGVAVVLWCYLGGLGNLYYQSGDWWARNAIFRDLITHDWPVVYESKDAALVYYIGFWLPAALIGKGAYLATGNLNIGWYIGNICLWFWAAVCIFITILMVMVLVGASNKKRFWLVLCVFIFFSGLDIIGTLSNKILRNINIPDHLEWWTNFQFSSMTTCLSWVFNQCIFGWLATACFLGEKNTRNYAFIVVLCAASSPLPCVGLGMYMLGYAAVLFFKALKNKQIIKFIGDVATPQNIIAALAVFPVYFLYYKTNLAVNVGQQNGFGTVPRDYIALGILAAVVVISFLIAVIRIKKSESFSEYISFGAITFCIFLLGFFNRSIQLYYLNFIFLECLVYLLLMWRKNKHRPLFWLTFVIMLACPLIHVGTASDFCMRASIPVVFITMFMCIEYLIDNSDALHKIKTDDRKEKMRAITSKVIYIALIAVLITGSITAVWEFRRGIINVADKGLLNSVNDTIYSFDQVFSGNQDSIDINFISVNYEDTFFFRYIAK